MVTVAQWSGTKGISSGYFDHRVMDIDFWGVVHGTKAFLPHILRSTHGGLVTVTEAPTARE